MDGNKMKKTTNRFLFKSEKLFTVLQKAGLGPEHFILNSDGSRYLNTDGTKLSATLEENRYSSDSNHFFFLYLGDQKIASTNQKIAPHEKYLLTDMSDGFQLPESLLGEKNNNEIDEIDNITGYEQKPDHILQTLVHAHETDLDKLFAEGMKRALNDPKKDWIVKNIIGACPDIGKKSEFETKFKSARAVDIDDITIRIVK